MAATPGEVGSESITNPPPPSTDSSTTRNNITVDWESRIVDCPSSITDIISFHNILRDLEASEEGVIYPPIIKYQEGDVGNGAKFPIVSFINSYRLRFTNPGSYTIQGGNLNCVIVPVAGVFVDRISSAAYAVTSVGGGGGATAQQIAVAVREELSTELTHLVSLQNGMGLNSVQATMLLEIYRMYGLDPTKPLVVTDTTRQAGSDIVQTIASNQNATTITRT